MNDTLLINPNCIDPSAEVLGWLARLEREAQAAGVSQAEVGRLFRQRGREIADEEVVDA